MSSLQWIWTRSKGILLCLNCKMLRGSSETSTGPKLLDPLTHSNCIYSMRKLGLGIDEDEVTAEEPRAAVPAPT
ncbi:Heat shock protein HSP 90-beta [Cricetulus griseus]|uniref:Heat shock protein HSP 90-beta n=1 Tax=Cricetulus griseus TaxID=10029 RepID=G3IK66_CRIGR|nr:Heat shock protein HSP 90-beta [Cricetulus griseus]